MRGLVNSEKGVSGRVETCPFDKQGTFNSEAPEQNLQIFGPLKYLLLHY